MIIEGGKAKDTLVGTSGSDFINGKRGADVLVSNGGDDVMKGGKGADTFVFAASPEGDDAVSQILDFQPGKDNILIIAEGFDSNVAGWYDGVTGLVTANAGALLDPIVTVEAGLYLFPGDIVIG